MAKAIEFFKNNFSTVLALAGAVGFGTCAAVFADAREILFEHTAGALLLIVTAFSLGYFAASFVLAKSRLAKHRAAKEREREAQKEKLAKLERVFASLSPRRKKLVAQALDEGSVHLSSLDSDALTLCNLKVFGMSPVAGMTTGADFSVQPSVVLEIREHRAEWLGM